MTVVQQPPERDLAFLAHAGLAPALIRGIVADAIRLNVPPDRMAIACGVVGETELYRALAEELGLPFVEQPVRADPASPYPGCIDAGVLRTRQPEPALLLAPQGHALQHLRRLLRGRKAPGAAITTPGNLRRSALASLGRRIDEAATQDLETAHPGASAQSGWTKAQIVSGIVAFVLLSFPLCYDWQATLQAAALVIGILFLINVLLRIAAAVVPASLALDMPDPALSDRDLPIYSVIVPLKREARVIGRLVEALLALDYPAAKLDIQIVLEADDRQTLQALKAVMPAGRFEILIAPPGRFETKPRALNIALALARGEFCVIYDAEDVPDPDQLRRAVAAFRSLPDSTACLQAQLSIDNAGDTWLTRLFAIEYAVLFDALIPSLALLGWPVMLGGTSNHFRTEILRRAGGWDAWNVTEDADLGLRLARLGYRVGALASTTMEEAPLTVSAWLRQRTRWLKGWMKTCMVHSRHPLVAIRQLGLVRFAVAVALSLGTVLTALFGPVLFGWTMYELASGSLLAASTISGGLLRGFALTLLIAGVLATLAPAVAALRHRGFNALLPWLALMPVYYLLVSVAAWRALLEWARHPQRWNKTEHGLARSSRSRQKPARKDDQKQAARAAATTSRNTASARQAHKSAAAANSASVPAQTSHLAGLVRELDASGVG